MTGPDCDHDMEYVRQWYGDPNVINGTADCSCWRCKICGYEESGEPPCAYDYE